MQILVDGTFSATALIVSDYASAIVSRYSDRLVKDRLVSKGVNVEASVNPVPRIWYNPPLESVNYIVPGLFAVLLMAFPPLLAALAIVREKERGTIEQMYVSPIKPSVFILGKVIPYAVIAFGEMLLVLATGTLWFQIPLKGSLGLLLGMSLIYVLCTVGIGVFVSTLTRTQLAAMLLTNMGIGIFIATLSRNLQQALLISFFVIFPVMFLSGTMVPVESMPLFMQRLSLISPVRYYMEITLGIFLKGIGLNILWPKLAVLLGFSTLIFPLSLYRLRKMI